MRGCFLVPVTPRCTCGAFPAYAGMFLWEKRCCVARLSFPRVCGDVSRSPFFIYSYWIAFPAYAGMFPSANYPKQDDLGFPRVCGDVSKEIYAQGTADELSPRMRGCFFLRLIFLDRSLAFPAYAGMFPRLDSMYPRVRSFPRVCGDVST